MSTAQNQQEKRELTAVELERLGRVWIRYAELISAKWKAQAQEKQAATVSAA